MNNEESQKLKCVARNVRKTVLQMANKSRGPHVGSCLSIVDILSYLYFHALDINKDNNSKATRDYMILSKGHAAMALYATLAEKEMVPRQILDGYLLDGGTLPAHLDRFSAPGIEVSAGSLGHGLPIGVGIAHGLKMKGMKNVVSVVIGDGESQEGAIWESALFAPRLELDNLIAFIDNNNLQGYGRPDELCSFQPVLEKWQAFGWNAIAADGHDFQSIHSAYREMINLPGPSVICLKTIKGKGVSFMEDELKWHYFIVTDEMLQQALEEIEHA